MPPRRRATAKKEPPTDAKILANLMANANSDMEFDTPIPISKVMSIIGSSGVFTNTFKSPAKTKFILDCWRFYSGNPFSYVINKYMYLDKPRNKLVVGPHYTEADLIQVYSNLPIFRMYAENLLHAVATEPLEGTMPMNTNLLMELLILGLKSTSHIKAEHPEFFMTTRDDTIMYRGFRLMGSDDSILLNPNKSFVSTTPDINIALQHAKPIRDDQSGVLVVYSFDSGITLVEVNKLHTDILISRIAQQSESELLLLPGYKFKLLEKGIFNKQSVAALHTFKNRKSTETQLVTGDDMEIPYYKIHVTK
jgi:hypothetical protein